MLSFGQRKSFTLIELLVVLAIVAILSTVVVMALNPAELLKQARDSNRLSDLSTLNTALAAYSADVTGGFMGTSTVVYVSVPDSSSVCANLGLPTLPGGYTYACAPTATYRKADGTGWIPVNFSQITFGAPLSSLPVDPVNATSSRNYYIYVSGGSFELSAVLEAAKNKLGGSNDLVSSDGGSTPDLYEVGSNKTLLPIDYGDSSLVGYWSFEEGPTGGATTSTDYSGYGNNGTWNGTSTPAQRYVAGKVGSWAANLNGTSDYFSSKDNDSLSFTSDKFTFSFWIKSNSAALATAILGKRSPWEYSIYTRNSASLTFYSWPLSGSGPAFTDVGTYDTSWNFFVWTADGSQSRLYRNGTLAVSHSKGAYDLQNGTSPLDVGRGGDGSGLYYFFGLLDDLRIYNRSFSGAEVSALYNATK